MMMQRKQNPGGFTLIELMVSIAIVVVLMVGVAKVFQYTGEAVGANQQMSDSVRNDRAIQSTMSADIPQMAADGAFLMIRGQSFPAFRNKQDGQSDADGNPLTWEKRTADTGAVSTSFAASPNERMHRQDRLSFMARGLFPRQTGNDGVFVAPMSSREAYVWYGHLCLPHTSGAFYQGGNAANPKTNPGWGTAGNNPQNYYASQWVLGRVATTLVQPTGASATPLSYGSIAIGNAQQQFIRRKWDNTSQTYLAPLDEGATSADGARTQDCRYDLAGTSISGFANIMRSALGVQWQPGVNYLANAIVSHRGYTYIAQTPHLSSAANMPNPVSPPTQWVVSFPISDWWSDIFMTARYECNPFVIKPIDSASYSQQAPVFAQACTQFIVEYTGDFLRQDTNPLSSTYGAVLDSFDNPNTPPPGFQHTDGETDFIVTWKDLDTDGLIDTNEASTVKRTTRWYGFPRDVDGDGVVEGYVRGTTVAWQLRDVIPFRDVAMTIHTIANINAAPFNALPFSANSNAYYDPAPSNIALTYVGAPFEKFGYQNNSGIPLARRDFYMNVGADSDNANGTQYPESYQCAWSPYDTVRPRMLRIIVTLDDPNSRFAEGQTFEYVYKLP